MDTGAITKAFAICQSEKVSISLIEGEILKLHHLLSRYLIKNRANQGHI